MTMKKLAGRIVFSVAALGLLGAAAAEAQVFPQANAPYSCTWHRYSSTGTLLQKSVSLVTFKNVTDHGYVQTGDVFNVYAGASTLTQPYEVVLDIIGGSEVMSFISNPNDPSKRVTCDLLSYDNANRLDWFNCSNFVKQWCRRP